MTICIIFVLHVMYAAAMVGRVLIGEKVDSAAELAAVVDLPQHVIKAVGTTVPPAGPLAGRRGMAEIALQGESFPTLCTLKYAHVVAISGQYAAPFLSLLLLQTLLVIQFSVGTGSTVSRLFQQGMCGCSTVAVNKAGGCIVSQTICVCFIQLKASVHVICTKGLLGRLGG